MNIYTREQCVGIVKHFEICTEALTALYDRETNNAISKNRKIHEKKKINRYLTEVGFTDDLSELSNDFIIEGTGFYGLVISSRKYPDLVYKWYFNGLDPMEDNKLIPNSKYIGYDFIDNPQGIAIPLDLYEHLPAVLFKNESGVLLDKMNLKNAHNSNDITDFDEMKIKHTAMYMDFLKEGFYIADYHIGNMEFNENIPMLLDLDLFFYSKELKESFNQYKFHHKTLYAILKNLNIFSHFGNYLYEFEEAYKRHNNGVKVSTNPLD